ncbi:MAG: NADH-quinone oxidoreductase subunit J [Prevotellaceae bacterium]|jgi:NADH-quinone oxidoreductase subunit J|nr:NADH-quinone oxidoreductase subunit J [Prevotellaceae bacterium]
MDIASLLIFYALAAFMLGMSLLAVTARRVLHAATYLLFVLIGTAGLYLLLNYHFLAAVQLSVYAGGIVILFIFAIFLTNEHDSVSEKHRPLRLILAGLGAVSGLCFTVLVAFTHLFKNYSANTTILGDNEVNMKIIGNTLMGTEKYQYLLPFEMLSILLLACIIGGILIARKQ